VFAALLVVIAGVLVAALLFFATGGTQDAPAQQEPLFLGVARDKVSNIREEGPQYIANPFGDAGLWLDLEDGELVVLSAIKPGTKSCIMKWREPRKAYVDSNCTDSNYTSRNLDRFKVTIGPLEEGAPKDAVYVDLRVKEPAPEPPETVLR
jgi:hypothetical protein